MEHQAKLNEKYMAVAIVPVLVTGNTNIKVPVYLKLQLRRRTRRYILLYLLKYIWMSYWFFSYMQNRKKILVSETFFTCSNSFLLALQLQTNQIIVYQYKAFLGLQVLVFKMVLKLKTNLMTVTHLQYFNTGIFGKKHIHILLKMTMRPN